MKLRIPTNQEIKAILVWGTTYSAIHVPYAVLWTGKQLFRLGAYTFTELEKLYKEAFIKPMNALMWEGSINQMHGVIDVQALPAEGINPITNVYEATKGKHVIILGDTGTGKSTTAQYIAVENAVLGSVRIKVYDCEGMFPVLPGWELVGKGEDWNAINASMQSDLDSLSEHFQQGKPECKDPTDIYIGEEYPDISDRGKYSEAVTRGKVAWCPPISQGFDSRLRRRFNRQTLL